MKQTIFINCHDGYCYPSPSDEKSKLMFRHIMSCHPAGSALFSEEMLRSFKVLAECHGWDVEIIPLALNLKDKPSV